MLKSTNYRSFIVVLCMGVLVWVVQVLPYLLGVYWGGSENFSTFLYKGAIGIAQDLVTYGFQANHALQEPTFFRVDPVTINEQFIQFPEGNIIILFLGLALYFLSDLTWVSIFLPLPFILISVLLIHQIVNLSMKSFHKYWTFLISVLIFLAGYDDILGFRKLVDFAFHGSVFISRTNSLVMGYMHRFPNAQVSFTFFLGWLYFVLKYSKRGKNADLYGVVLFMAINQYVYFYYWSFQVILTAMLLAYPMIKRGKQFIGPLTLYLLMVLPFWVNYYWFIQSEVYADFSILISGLDHYSFWGTAVFFFLYFLLDSKRNWVVFLVPIIFNVGVMSLGYIFQEYHWVFRAGRIMLITFLVITTLVFMCRKRNITQLNLAENTYWATCILLHLKFLIGFNIEPYHWVYVGSYPILILCIIQAAGKNKQIAQPKNIILMSCFLVSIALFNGMVYAKVNFPYWQWTADESAALRYLKKEDKTILVAGNNFAQTASLCVNSGKKLYTGIAHLGDLNREESSKRLIQSYRCMGYDDQAIMKEFISYKQRKKYEEAYESNIDSLPTQWPDNFTLIAEVILDYWHTSDDYKGTFEDVLYRKNLDVNLMPDLLIIQEPQEFMVDPAYVKVVYTETLSLYKRVDSP